MKALVTGCAGFIGCHLVDKLLNLGCNVVGIDCSTDYYTRAIKEGNIAVALELGHFPSVAYVFHLAARAGARASRGSSFEICTRNNIEAKQRLLEFYKDEKIKKFVFSSYSSVYGDVELPMRGDSLLRHVSPYGVTKLAGENLCYLYWKNYNLPTVSLRYFTVYVPGQRPAMAIYKFIQAILDGEEIAVYGDGTQTRDFTYVDDAVEVNILATTTNLVGEVLNVGSGSRISVKELIKLIKKITCKTAKIEYMEKQKGDVNDTLADITKLLRWTSKTMMEEGLGRRIKWMKSKS